MPRRTNSAKAWYRAVPGGMAATEARGKNPVSTLSSAENQLFRKIWLVTDTRSSAREILSITILPVQPMPQPRGNGEHVSAVACLPFPLGLQLLTVPPKHHATPAHFVHGHFAD